MCPRWLNLVNNAEDIVYNNVHVDPGYCCCAVMLDVDDPTHLLTSLRCLSSIHSLPPPPLSPLPLVTVDHTLNSERKIFWGRVKWCRKFNVGLSFRKEKKKILSTVWGDLRVFVCCIMSSAGYIVSQKVQVFSIPLIIMLPLCGNATGDL